MAKRVAADGASQDQDEETKKARTEQGEEGQKTGHVPPVFNLLTPDRGFFPALSQPPNNNFWQLYISQLEKWNLVAERVFRRRKSAKRVHWKEFYRRKTDEYDVELPLDYSSIRVVSRTENKLTLSAVQKDTGDMFIVRRVNSSDHQRIQKIFRTLMLHRLIPTDTVMRPCEVYIRNEHIYTIAEYMESQLKEVIEDPSTHFCVGRVVHQLLFLLNKMHKLGIVHGNINTSSVYYDSDMSIKLSNYGNSGGDENVGREEAVKKDLIAIRSILAKLLLASDSERDKKTDDEEEELEWKPLAESSTDSGLTDENARDLLDLMFENKYSCEDLLQHNYFQSFKFFEYFEPECGELLDLSVKKTIETENNNIEVCLNEEAVALV